jgi:hypothetical protein
MRIVGDIDGVWLGHGRLGQRRFGSLGLQHRMGASAVGEVWWATPQGFSTVWAAVRPGVHRLPMARSAKTFCPTERNRRSSSVRVRSRSLIVAVLWLHRLARNPDRKGGEPNFG